MIDMNKNFTEYFKIAHIHAERLNQAFSGLKKVFPLDSIKFKNLLNDEFFMLETLIYRFSKLQDFIGTKLIDAFLIKKGEYLESMSMIDKVNKLERLQVIDSAENWHKLRQLRNHIAHEYPDHQELAIKYLNEVYQQIPYTLGILNNLEKL